MWGFVWGFVWSRVVYGSVAYLDALVYKIDAVVGPGEILQEACVG